MPPRWLLLHRLRSFTYGATHYYYSLLLWCCDVDLCKSDRCVACWVTAGQSCSVGIERTISLGTRRRRSSLLSEWDSWWPWDDTGHCVQMFLIVLSPPLTIGNRGIMSSGCMAGCPAVVHVYSVFHVWKQQASWKSLSPGHLGKRCESDAQANMVDSNTDKPGLTHQRPSSLIIKSHVIESCRGEWIVLNELRYTALNIGNCLLLSSSWLSVPFAILYCSSSSSSRTYRLTWHKLQ